MSKKSILKHPQHAQAVIMLNVQMIRYQPYVTRKRFFDAFTAVFVPLVRAEKRVRDTLARSAIEAFRKDCLVDQTMVRAVSAQQRRLNAAAIPSQRRRAVSVAAFQQDVDPPTASSIDAQVRDEQQQQRSSKLTKFFILSLIIFNVMLYVASEKVSPILPYLSQGATSQYGRVTLAGFFAALPLFSVEGALLRALMFFAVNGSVSSLAVQGQYYSDLLTSHPDAIVPMVDRVQAGSVLNGMGSMWHVLGSAQGAATDITTTRRVIQSAATQFTFYTGQPLSSAPAYLSQTINMTSSMIKSLQNISLPLYGQLTPANAFNETIVNLENTAMILNNIQKLMGESNETYAIQILRNATATGTQSGFLKIIEWYEDHAVALQSQFWFTLLYSFLFIEAPSLARYAYYALRGLRSDARLLQQFNPNGAPQRTNYALKALRKLAASPIAQTVAAGALLEYSGAVVAAQNVATSALQNQFQQDKKEKKKRKPSEFNKRVGAELRKYKTKAKSAAQQRERFKRAVAKAKRANNTKRAKAKRATKK